MFRFPFLRLSSLAVLYFGLLFTACTVQLHVHVHESSDKPTPPINERLTIHFQRIDNQARIYRIDQQRTLIYDSGVIHQNPQLNLEVDLTPHLQAGPVRLEVELINDESWAKSPWEIQYHMALGGREIARIHRKSGTDPRNGIVYSEVHAFNL